MPHGLSDLPLHIRTLLFKYLSPPDKYEAALVDRSFHAASREALRDDDTIEGRERLKRLFIHQEECHAATQKMLNNYLWMKSGSFSAKKNLSAEFRLRLTLRDLKNNKNRKLNAPDAKFVGVALYTYDMAFLSISVMHHVLITSKKTGIWDQFVSKLLTKIRVLTTIEQHPYSPLLEIIGELACEGLFNESFIRSFVAVLIDRSSFSENALKTSQKIIVKLTDRNMFHRECLDLLIETLVDRAKREDPKAFVMHAWRIIFLFEYSGLLNKEHANLLTPELAKKLNKSEWKDRIAIIKSIGQLARLGVLDIKHVDQLINSFMKTLDDNDREVSIVVMETFGLFARAGLLSSSHVKILINPLLKELSKVNLLKKKTVVDAFVLFVRADILEPFFIKKIVMKLLEIVKSGEDFFDLHQSILEMLCHPAVAEMLLKVSNRNLLKNLFLIKLTGDSLNMRYITALALSKLLHIEVLNENDIDGLVDALLKRLRDDCNSYRTISYLTSAAVLNSKHADMFSPMLIADYERKSVNVFKAITDTFIQFRRAEILNEWHHVSIVNVLISKFKDKNPEVRQVSVQMIIKLACVGVLKDTNIELLILELELLLRDREEVVRRVAVFAFGQFARLELLNKAHSSIVEKKLVRVIMDQLESDEFSTRIAASQAYALLFSAGLLSKVDDNDWFNPLIEKFSVDDADIRDAATHIFSLFKVRKIVNRDGFNSLIIRLINGLSSFANESFTSMTIIRQLCQLDMLNHECITLLTPLLIIKMDHSSLDFRKKTVDIFYLFAVKKLLNDDVFKLLLPSLQEKLADEYSGIHPTIMKIFELIYPLLDTENKTLFAINIVSVLKMRHEGVSRRALDTISRLWVDLHQYVDIEKEKMIVPIPDHFDQLVAKVTTKISTMRLTV